MRAFHAGQQRSDCSATTGALDWSRRTTCAARPSRHAARAPDGIVDSPCVPHASQEQQSSSKSRAMAADGTLLSAHRPCTSHSPRAHGCTLATRSHTRIHCMRRAAACRGESLTDRPRVCACATPGRPFWSCTLPSHPNPSCMQKERHQSVKVRPSAAMARATSPSPACARVPSEPSQSDRACVRPSQGRVAVLRGRGDRVERVLYRSVGRCAYRLSLV